MASNCKYCFLCANYDGYYVKGDYSFYKKSHGDCRKKHCIVSNNDSCENWEPHSGRQKPTIQIKLNKLEKLAENLSQLIIILQENIEEK